MKLEQETLSKLQSIAAIISAIAIPVVLAVIGYVVQDKMSTEGIKKDYVGIAIGILKDANVSKDEDMRKWAVSVLDVNSPVPFSKDLRTRLEQGTTFVPVAVPCAPFPGGPGSCMEPPENMELLGKKDPSTLKELPVTGKDLLLNIVENAKRFHMNKSKLECLQEWIREMKKIDDAYQERSAARFKSKG